MHHPRFLDRTPLIVITMMSAGWSLVPVALGWLIAAAAAAQWGTSACVFGFIVAGIATAVWMGILAAVVLVTVSTSPRARWAAALCALPSVLTCLTPVAVRAALPWEDPTTGDGSPMAVLVGLVMWSVVMVVVFALPTAAAPILVTLWPSSPRATPR